MRELLAALDLSWVHWPSAVMGVLLFFATFYAAVVVLLLVGRLVRWIIGAERRELWRVGGARTGGPPHVARSGIHGARSNPNTTDPVHSAEAGDPDPIEGAYTVPQPRRRIDHKPVEHILTGIESRALLRGILGDASRGSWQ